MEYIEITKDEYDYIQESGYDFPNIAIQDILGDITYLCEEKLFDMYESKCLNMCEII